MRRLPVAPGITGLWRVMAHNTVAFDDIVKFDIEYFQNMNMWLDLKIKLLAPVEMIRGKGSG
jgi:lipopolysaccharide/colanic/teichoic acid biosynthesis glycosyltransferase